MNDLDALREDLNGIKRALKFIIEEEQYGEKRVARLNLKSGSYDWEFNEIMNGLLERKERK
jgi:hypothetical protein